LNSDVSFITFDELTKTVSWSDVTIYNVGEYLVEVVASLKTQASDVSKSASFLLTIEVEELIDEVIDDLLPTDPQEESFDPSEEFEAPVHPEPSI